jgi:peptide/nickel transport system substrate-binding protein
VRNRRGRGLFLLVLIAGIAVITGFWYLASSDEEAPAPDFGGDYVEGVTGAPSRVNPLFAEQNDADQTLVSLVFAGLTRLDDRGAPFPDLASTWSVSQDGLTYTISLRPDLAWQDGTPLTAQDVVFTYGLLQGPDLRQAPPLAQHLKGATVTAPDPSTIVIALPAPYAPLPAYLTTGILPEHLLTGLTVAQIGDSFFNQQPVGAGPYRLERLTPGEADLVANANYHLQQPFIQHMRLRFYRDDGELFAALDAKAIQGALFHSVLGEKELLALQRRKDLRVTPLVSGELSYIYLNLDVPALQDRRTRQALLYAIDRDAIVSQLLDGQGTVAQSPIIPGSWAYAPSLQRYEADLQQAGLLLDDAGWKREGDGVRRRGGQSLAFTLTTPPDPLLVSIAQQVVDDWNALGAQVQLAVQGVTTIVRELIESRSYDALLLSQATEADPDPYDEWHSPAATRAHTNLSDLKDARIDSQLEEGRVASYTHRKELYESFQELFAQEVPSLPLYATTAYYVQDTSVQGARPGLLIEPGDRFWQVQEWYLKTR